MQSEVSLPCSLDCVPNLTPYLHKIHLNALYTYVYTSKVFFDVQLFPTKSCKSMYFSPLSCVLRIPAIAYCLILSP